MNPKLDITKVVRASQITGESSEETVELRQMMDEASKYLRAFSWCADILESYLGIGFPGVVGVFLFKIRPARAGIDEWIWIVVGDLPYAYITSEDAPNPACALDGYIGAMEEWVQAAQAGRPITDIIPVNVPPTPENANRLASSLKFLDREILSRYRDDLSS
jgi:hypothetical protein